MSQQSVLSASRRQPWAEAHGLEFGHFVLDSERAGV